MNREQVIGELERLLPWSKPREVPTSRGPRILRKAAPTEAFWNAWRAGREMLKAVGISCGRDSRPGGTGEWEVCWWQEVSQEVVHARAEAVEQSRATDAEITVPAPAGLAYMPFQRAGIRFALGRTATLFGDEMGLGKTIQAIGFINAHPETQRVLVVTKATLKMNWWRELRKWLVNPELRNSIGLVEGKVFPTTKICIINYDICAKWAGRLHKIDWDVVVLDEAHVVKNRKAQRTIAVCGYKPGRDEPVELLSTGIPAKYRLALTGTPIENNLEEMWTVLWWLNRDEFPSRWTLLKLAGASKRPGGVYIPPTDSGLARLQEFLRRTVMVRRLKADVLPELPAKTRMVTEFDTEGMEDLIRQEREIWETNEEERVRVQAEVEVARASDNPEDYKKAVEKMREVQSIAFAEMARIRRETAVAKIPKMIAHIRDRLEEVQKLIVFAHHTEVLEAFGREFGNQCVVIHGGTPLPVRDERVHRFQTDGGCRIFAGSIRATGEGLTLTAASYVLFHEFDWVPSKMVQCEDRAHRIGQTDNVTVEVCVVNGTIDAKMAKTCVEKAELAEKALDAQVKKELVEEPAPVVVDWKPLATKRELEADALLITEEQRNAVSAALNQLVMFCDGARKLDGMGFSKMDAAIGRDLAARNPKSMSYKQAALGARLVCRYQRQLDQGLVEKATRGLIKRKSENESE